ITVHYIDVFRPACSAVARYESDRLHAIRRFAVPTFPCSHRREPPSVWQFQNRMADFEARANERRLNNMRSLPAYAEVQTFQQEEVNRNVVQVLIVEDVFVGMCRPIETSAQTQYRTIIHSADTHRMRCGPLDFIGEKRSRGGPG